MPVYVMIGNIIEADKRAPGVEWMHSAIDPAAIVRDFVKWDDQPASLQHFAESAVRAYKIAMTPPMAPVLLSLDAELQENPIADSEGLRIPKLATVVPPVGDAGALGEAAKMLIAAENPVLICDRLTRTPAGMARLVELAETVAMRGDRQCRPHELSLAPSAQSIIPQIRHFARQRLAVAEHQIEISVRSHVSFRRLHTCRRIRVCARSARTGHFASGQDGRGCAIGLPRAEARLACRKGPCLNDSGVPRTFPHETVLSRAREFLAFRAHRLWQACFPLAFFEEAGERGPSQWLTVLANRFACARFLSNCRANRQGRNYDSEENSFHGLLSHS